jgi:MATE family multidrug resistance protein
MLVLSPSNIREVSVYEHTPYKRVIFLMSANEIQDGSLSQLWKISSSLMISFFSMVAMAFCDRLFLANYSASALSAAASAGTLFWAGNFFIVTLCSMAEVFVAQYNGAKKYEKLGEVPWQMIWLTLFSSIFFFLLATVGADLFQTLGFFNSSEVCYYKWNHLFSPVYALLAAISAFFIGQGKTQIIKWMAILGNLINIALDPLFIFGVDGWIPSMGIKGAAIATGIGVIIQVVILGILFLSPENQRTFGTNRWKFDFSTFWQTLRVGISPGVFVIIELVGWALFYKMMVRISSHHILVASITQSILILLMFFGLGLEKGAAAIAGNLIGAKRFHEVKQVFYSGLILCLLFAGILTLILIGFPDPIINWFFYNPGALEGEFMFSRDLILETKSAIKFGMGTLIFYLTFENIRYLLSGLLISYGDSLFLLIAGAGSIWLFMLIPTYFFMSHIKTHIHISYLIWIAYSLLSCLFLYLRFLRGKWRENTLIEEPSIS